MVEPSPSADGVGLLVGGSADGVGHFGLGGGDCVVAGSEFLADFQAERAEAVALGVVEFYVLGGEVGGKRAEFVKECTIGCGRRDGVDLRLHFRKCGFVGVVVFCA